MITNPIIAVFFHNLKHKCEHTGQIKISYAYGGAPVKILKIIVAGFYLAICIGLFSVIYGENEILIAQQKNPLIRLEESYQFDKLLSYLQVVEKQGIDLLPARYLRALLEEDGPQALSIYQEVVARDTMGVYADRALWRIAQYYYIKQDFRQSNSVLLSLVGRYPKSVYTAKARDQIARIASLGGAPHSSDPVSGAPPQAASETQRGQFTIQAGAFSGPGNAGFMQKHIQGQGFSNVYISKRQIGGKLLYLVWVGSYFTRGEAEQEKVRLSRKIRNIEFFVKALP